MFQLLSFPPRRTRVHRDQGKRHSRERVDLTRSSPIPAPMRKHSSRYSVTASTIYPFIKTLLNFAEQRVHDISFPVLQQHRRVNGTSTVGVPDFTARLRVEPTKKWKVRRSDRTVKSRNFMLALLMMYETRVVSRLFSRVLRPLVL